jgi:hypothetical protein
MAFQYRLYHGGGGDTGNMYDVLTPPSSFFLRMTLISGLLDAMEIGLV